MKTLIAIITLYCCFFSLNSSAQTVGYSIRGSVIDTAAKARLDGATITVVAAKDSILQKFAYTKKGVFIINNLKSGKFLLIVTYPEFADYMADFVLDANHQQKDFGDVILTSKSKLLNDVIIKAKVVAMKIKGDTTEFNAAAYATQKNAKVGDLLKQLPGMRINQSGVILFQGEQVGKILVDGEEFFSDDPGLITKNVRADMVSKIQVYDDKSEYAKRTGVEDGQKVKTINVVLREDKRRGVFGKADAGVGTDKRFADQLMANKFSPKEKVAVYGNIANTGSSGLGGSDNDRYGGGFGGSFGGTGLPKSVDAGAHYDAKWNKDKQSINSTYKIGSLGVDNASSNLTQNALTDGFNRVASNNSSHRYTLKQALNTYFSTALDSLSSLEFSVNGSLSNSNEQSTGFTTTTRGNGVLQNSNDTYSNGENKSKNYNGSLHYTKRFKKPGRSVSISTYFYGYTSNSNDYFKSNLKYYGDAGLLDSAHTTDQYKPYNGNYLSNSANVSYTEPLSKSFTASLSYSLSESNNNSNQRSYNKSAGGIYDVADLLHSNDYSNHRSDNRYSIYLNYRKNKISTGMGTGISQSDETRTDHIVDSVLKRRFINWSPNAYFNFQLGKSEYFSINYDGSTRQPDIYQIQPLRQNSDPLNITIGNPNLRPEFDNSIKFRYYLYRPTHDSGINIWAGYSNQVNQIINNRATDSAGNNVYQYSNLKGHQSSSWYFHFNTYNHLTKLDFLLYPGINMSGNTSYNYVNGQLSKNRSVTYNPGIDLEKNASTFGYGLSASYTYTTNAANLQNAANNTKGYNTSFNFNTKLPFNFFIGSEGNYEFRGANQVFHQNFSKFLLKAWFGKTFLKEENLKIAVTGNDLLNQNTGYSRSGDSNSFSESRNEVIRRYFIFSITWDFTKFKKIAQSVTPVPNQ